MPNSLRESIRWEAGHELGVSLNRDLRYLYMQGIQVLQVIRRLLDPLTDILNFPQTLGVIRGNDCQSKIFRQNVRGSRQQPSECIWRMQANGSKFLQDRRWLLDFQDHRRKLGQLLALES
jgi:hypothetical protein